MNWPDDTVFPDAICMICRKECDKSEAVWTGDEDAYAAPDAVKYLNKLPHEAKSFSTKEAAELWIEAHNKPKEIIVSPDSQYEIAVTKSQVLIKCKGAIHGDNIIIWPSEIQQINDALKSLQ